MAIEKLLGIERPLLASERPIYYGLAEDGETPTPFFDMEGIGEYLGNSGDSSRRNRVVQQEHVGSYYVSTVFLAVDHGFGKTPVLWETMVFWSGEGAPEASLDYQWRYTSAQKARRGHERVVKCLQTKGYEALESLEIEP